MLFVWCSMREPGLFDYILVNDELDVALQHLARLASLALQGQVNMYSADRNMCILVMQSPT